MQRFNGRAEASGIVVTSGLSATTPADLTYAGATVTVNVHGGGLASIFSDNAGTPLANPFTANADCTFSFYAANGRYDVVVTGVGVPTINLSDILLFDSSLVSGALNPLAFSATPVFNAASFSLFSMTLTGNVTSSTIPGGTTGQIIVISLTQGAGGPWTFAWPASVANPPTLAPTAGITEQFTLALLSDAKWHLIGMGEFPINQLSGVTGTGGVFVEQQSPTINTPTLSSPTISGTLGGTPIAVLGATSVTSLSDSGNATISGTLGVTGTITTSNLLGMPVAGTTTYPTIAAAYAALSPGQCMAIPGNYTETLSANLTFGTSNTCILALGRATITQGAFQVIVSAGVNGFYMASLSPPGPLGNGTQGAQIAFVGYTGTAEAFKVGAAGSNTTDIDLRNVYVSLVSAGAGAIGFALYRTQVSYLEHDSCFTNGSSNNQICYLYDAKDGFSTHKMQVQCFCNGGVGAATGQVCIRQTGNVSNSGGGGWITGGDYTLQGSAVAGTICFDILTGDTWLFNNPSCENSILGLHVGGSTQNIAVEGYVRFDSTVGTVAQFDAGSASNHIITNNNGTVVDNGNANSVETPDRYQMNTRLWSTRAGQLSGAGDYVIFDTVANKARFDIAPASTTGRTAISGDGGGDVRFNVNSGTGGVLGFNGAGGLVWNLDSTGKFTTYNGLPTAGTGVAPNLGTPVNLTGQVANLGATTIYTTAASGVGSAGLYRVCVALWPTVTGNTTALQANAIAPSGAGTVTIAAGAVLNTAALTNGGGGCTMVHAAASSAIQLSTTGYNTTGTYSIQATVEQVL